MQRRDFIRLAGAAAATSSLSLPLHAQASFPSQPIKLLLAFAAGGSTDAMFRVMAENASPLFGQTVIVEAKPGGGGTMAGQLLLQARPDGYTLAQLPISVFRLPYTQKITWNPVTEFSYVIGITGYSFGIAVPSDSPIKTWADLVAWAKANPGKLTYATSGIYTTPHLTMEDISHRLGIEMNHIPYKGMAEIIPAILGGQVMAVADSIGFGPHVLSGKLRLLCTWGATRAKKFPDAPTLTELGIPIVQNSPYGLVGPKGMDPAIVKKLHDVFKRAIEMNNHIEVMGRYDQELLYMSPEQYRKFAEDTMAREKVVIERLKAMGKVT
ncbi:MAG TPA: tripartite tricarboxylate transporter substrate binding protein [Rhizobacter sp.]